MDPKPKWTFKKGNIDMMVTQSGVPISKEKIDQSILDFLYGKFPNDSRLLRTSGFTMEFIGVDKTTVFIKIVTEGVENKTVEVKLIGGDAEKFVNLVNSTLIPPDSKN